MSRFSDDSAAWLSAFFACTSQRARTAHLSKLTAFPLSGGWREVLTTAADKARSEGHNVIADRIGRWLRNPAKVDAVCTVGAKRARCSGPGSKRGYQGVSGVRHPDCTTYRPMDAFGIRRERRYVPEGPDGQPDIPTRYTVDPAVAPRHDEEKGRWQIGILFRQNACRQCRNLPRVGTVDVSEVA